MWFFKLLILSLLVIGIVGCDNSNKNKSTNNQKNTSQISTRSIKNQLF